MGFSFVRAAVTCAILERTSGLEPSSETNAPMYLKLVAVPNFCPSTFISRLMPARDKQAQTMFLLKPCTNCCQIHMKHDQTLGFTNIQLGQVKSSRLSPLVKIAKTIK